MVESCHSRIRKGNQEWLAVASALEPGVDASTAEDLKAALSEAIPHNPAGVLAILKDDKPLLTIEQVCAFANFQKQKQRVISFCRFNQGDV
jgi:hypothetical protein